MFYYIWAFFFYISTAISTLFSRVPILSIVGSLIVILASVINKLIILVWLTFDYIIIFIKDIFLPILIKILTFIKSIFLWIWKKILYFIRLFIPECKAHKVYCLKFDKNSSYALAQTEDKDFTQKNHRYEAQLYEYFQKKVHDVYTKDKKDLDILLKKAIQSKKHIDVQKYNELLTTLQVNELNIQSNYYLSLDQHRLILKRHREDALFEAYKPLKTQASQTAIITQEVLV